MELRFNRYINDAIQLIILAKEKYEQDLTPLKNEIIRSISQRRTDYNNEPSDDMIMALIYLFKKENLFTEHDAVILEAGIIEACECVGKTKYVVAPRLKNKLLRGYVLAASGQK